LIECSGTLIESPDSLIECPGTLIECRRNHDRMPPERRSDPSGIRRLGQLEIDVHQGFDAALLRAVVEALTEGKQ
jgi:hypothetical protein